ncbi:unnamed protein product [Penicillium olsonii]|nr:unnamed protein product [Penicillium olsonii]
MPELSAIVAISASCAAVVIIFSVVGILVWIRHRKRRRLITLLGLNPKNGQVVRGLQSFPIDTLTELSQAEGSVLLAHGQLPYGKPTEWGQLTSRESLLRPKSTFDSPFPLSEKAQSLRRSLSRSQSRRYSRSSHKRLSSFATSGASSQHPSPPPKGSISRDDVPLSAVEGILELSAERTPTQTPEPPENEQDKGFHLGMQPIPPAWPLPGQGNRSGPFSVSDDDDSPCTFDPPSMVFEESPRRLRGISIASQTAGTMPGHTIPPPPLTAYPPDRFSYARNDSIARLSSMSLDTTNSSILDDGRNGPRSAESEFASPSFPSGGTFVPFSAADVGVKDGRRTFITTNTSIPPMHNFPVRSSSTTEPRHKPASVSPRRSMTTRQYSGSSFDMPNMLPRRTDSLSSSNPPSRHGSFRSGTPVGRMNHSGSQLSLTSQTSFFYNPTVYEDDETENDPFYVGSPGSGTLFHPVGSPGRQASSAKPPSPMQRSSSSLRMPPPSALKNGNSVRKGHRRQNCVRISIHPPMTFAPSTVEEEPEDYDKMEELDLRESAINEPKKILPVLPQHALAPHSSSRRGKYGSRNGKQPSFGSLGPLVEEPQPVGHESPSHKRTNVLSTSAANKQSARDPSSLPELVTSIPQHGNLNAGGLSHTPTPERATPLWELPEAPSPSRENYPSAGGPRRSGVKGPRNQPQAHALQSQSTPVSTPSTDTFANNPFGDPSRLPLITSITGTEGSDWRKSTDSVNRVKGDAHGAFRRSHDSINAVDKGLGPIGPSSGIYNFRRSSSMSKEVTIFEDSDRTPTKPKLLPPVGTLTTPESSPTHGENKIPRSLQGNQAFPPPNNAPPTPTSPSRGLATPTSKSLGIGIGTATPGSLYDGDGFLRE